MVYEHKDCTHQILALRTKQLHNQESIEEILMNLIAQILNLHLFQVYYL